MNPGVSMGRAAGECAPTVGLQAQTWYDKQSHVYGVRDKWQVCPSVSSDDKCEVYAGMLMKNLCKPWEQGGHPHDFLRAARTTRTTDLHQHYETKRSAIERHEKLLEDLEAWRRQELLKEDMLIRMSKLQAIQRQRRHFQDLRRQIREEQLIWSRTPSFRTVSKKELQESSYIMSMGSCQPAFQSGNVNLSTLSNQLKPPPRLSPAARPRRKASTAPSSARSLTSSVNDEVSLIRIPTLSRASGAARLELQELDAFEARLQSLSSK